MHSHQLENTIGMNTDTPIHTGNTSTTITNQIPTCITLAQHPNLNLKYLNTSNYSTAVNLLDGKHTSIELVHVLVQLQLQEQVQEHVPVQVQVQVKVELEVQV